MRLEDEIKQTSFKSQRQKLAVNLIYSYNWLTGGMKEVFKRFGITMQQYNILRILRGQYPKPSTLNLLRNRMLDKQSDVSRLLDRLEKKGLISRTTCKEDRRKMDVVITKEGLDLLELMDSEMHRLENLSEALSDSEVMQLNELLDQLRG